VFNSNCILLEKIEGYTHEYNYIHFGSTKRNPLFYQYCAEAANAVRGTEPTFEEAQSIAPTTQSGASYSGQPDATTGTHWVCSVSPYDPVTFPCSLEASSATQIHNGLLVRLEYTICGLVPVD